MSIMQTGSLRLRSDDPPALGGDTSTFKEVALPTPFSKGAKVILIPMVQTFSGGETPGIRIADVTEAGFKIPMNELGAGSASNGIHKKENIGCVAFSV